MLAWQKHFKTQGFKRILAFGLKTTRFETARKRRIINV